MKKSAIGMVVVFLLTVAFASRGEGANKYGCVTTVHHYMRDGKIRAAVEVAGTFFYFHANKMMVSPPHDLTLRQLVRWEPVLASFRAAATAKVKVKIKYNTSSKRVRSIRIRFNVPC